MRLRKRHLSLVAVLGVAVAVLPALASSAPTPAVEAVVAGSEGIYTKFAWSPAEVMAESGGAVAFSTGSTTEPHGIVWKSGPSTPACGSSVPVGEGHFSSHWSGSCTFAVAGTYRYYCSYHGESMSGTVSVSAAGTTTTTTTSPSPTTTSPTTSTPTPTPAPVVNAKTMRARKLAKALRVCRKKPRGKRAACVRRAHRRFGTPKGK